MKKAPEPAKMSSDEVIDQLRALRPKQRVTATAAQLRVIIDDVTACRDLEDTITNPELEGLGPVGVLDVVAEFGKHRARVKKRTAVKALPQTWEQVGVLFGTSREHMLAAARQQVTNERRAATTAARATGEPARRSIPKPRQVDALFADTANIAPPEVQAKAPKVSWPEPELAPPVILPRGYERDCWHRRDIGKSIAALAVTPVEEEEIIRFVARHYEVQTSMLDADHVTMLWWVLSEGLGEKLIEIGPSNSTLADLLVQAYDLLDVARTDALAGIATLTSGELDPGTLRRAIARCRWLSPGELDRLSKVIAEVEAHPDNARLGEILSSRLRQFAAWVSQHPSTFAIRGVEGLNEAHLVQILASSGLVGDEVAEKEMAAELRSRLTLMGLAADLDREISEGLRAWKSGTLEEFYASRQARADGDTDWAVAYAEALADAEAATRVSASV